jgi:hypothetical protein
MVEAQLRKNWNPYRLPIIKKPNNEKKQQPSASNWKMNYGLPMTLRLLVSKKNLTRGRLCRLLTPSPFFLYAAFNASLDTPVSGGTKGSRRKHDSGLPMRVKSY